MIKMVSIGGLLLGFTMMFAAFMSWPNPTSVEAQVGTASGEACVARDFALDEGYGVTRTETRLVCSKG
jgi:hypothetical protein